MTKKLVKVLIPIYKSELTKVEEASLKQCVKLLSEFPIIFVQPKSLYSSNINYDGLIKTEVFEDHFFKDVFGYNSLMLSEVFYERFIDSEYILIYQLDAYVFKNELKYWCSKGYDYIGAPWIASKNTVINRFLKTFHSSRKKARQAIFFKVGNGGFSLRRVSSFFYATQKLKLEIEDNLKRNRNDFWIMEDVFWSLTAPTHLKNFLIPGYKEALKFAIDRKPKLAFKLNNQVLPFGCHGLEKTKAKSFWQEKINSLK
jgi:hypothetical protein